MASDPYDQYRRPSPKTTQAQAAPKPKSLKPKIMGRPSTVTTKVVTDRPPPTRGVQGLPRTGRHVPATAGGSAAQRPSIATHQTPDFRRRLPEVTRPTEYQRPVDATSNPRGSVRFDPEIMGWKPHAGWGSDGQGIQLRFDGKRAPGSETPQEQLLRIQRQLHTKNPGLYDDPDARRRTTSGGTPTQPGSQQQAPPPPPPDPTAENVARARAAFEQSVQNMNEAAGDYGQAGSRQYNVDWSSGAPRVMYQDAGVDHSARIAELEAILARGQTGDDQAAGIYSDAILRTGIEDELARLKAEHSPGTGWVEDTSQNWGDAWGGVQGAYGVLGGGPVKPQDFSKVDAIVDRTMGTADTALSTAQTAGRTADRVTGLGMVQPHHLMQTGQYESGAMSMPQLLNQQQDILRATPSTAQTALEAEAATARQMGFDSPEAMQEWLRNARGSSVNDMEGLTGEERSLFDQQLHSSTQIMRDSMERAIDNIAGETGSTQQAFMAADQARRQIGDYRIQHQLGVFEADLMRKQTNFQAQQEQYKQMVAQGAMSNAQYVSWVHTDRAMTMQGWAQQMEQTLATFNADVGASGQHYDQRARTVNDYANRQLGAGQLQVNQGQLQLGAGQLQLGAGRLDLDRRAEAFHQERTAVNDYINNMKTVVDMDMGLKTAIDNGMDRQYERHVRPHAAKMEASAMQLANNVAFYEAMFSEQAHRDSVGLAREGIEVQKQALAAQRAAQSANTAMGIFGMLFKGILGAATGGLLG